MSEELDRYLLPRYRNEILNEKARVAPFVATPELIAEIEAELAHIASLKLGPHLPNRSFPLSRRKRYLEELLAEAQAATRKIKGGPSANQAREGGSPAGDAEILSGQAPQRKQERSGRDEPEAGNRDKPQSSWNE